MTHQPFKYLDNVDMLTINVLNLGTVESINKTRKRF